jgi:NADH-quinone oxidoreductase subunit G
VVHPDGRIQRLRTAIAHPGNVRSGWWIIAEIAKQIGTDFDVLASPMAFAQLSHAVPFYEGLTLDDIGGRGVRWPDAAGASKFSASTAAVRPSGAPASAPASTNGAPPVAGELKLGTYRPIWAAPEVEVSPALKFLASRQQAELSPEDASRLSLTAGDQVEVSQNDSAVRADVVVRTGVPAGTVFLAEGIGSASANVFTGGSVTVVKAAERELELAGAYNVQPPGEVPDEISQSPLTAGGDSE